MTSRDRYRSALTRGAAILLAAASGIYLLTPGRWFSFYGWAAILLVAVALFSPPLVRRLQDLGRWRAWALLFIVPATLIALVQIGFWQVFFRFGPTNPVPGVIREMFWINAGFAVPYATAALAFTWLWLFWSTGRNRP